MLPSGIFRHTSPKQLVTGFLAIAVLASSFTFALSWMTPGEQPRADLAAKSGIPGIGRNAFVEQLSEKDLAKYAAFNLTEAAAETFAKKLLEANPAGPLARGGALSATAPDVDRVVAEYLAEDRVVGSILAETLPYNPRITLAKTTSPEERGRYIEETMRVIRDRLQTETLANLPDTAPTLAALDAAEIALHGAVAELEKIEVPKDMKDLHVNLVRTLAYSKEVFGLRGGSSDPLKEMILLEDRSRKAAEASDAYQAEFAKLEFTSKTSWTDDSADLSLFDRMLGIQQAEATLPPFVPTSVILELSPTAISRTGSEAGSWVQKVIEWGKKLVTEIIKDQIVHKIIQQTIRWVQGGGTPQFVTNWKSLLRDSFSNAAGNLINEIYPQLCQGFAPLVKVALFPVQTAPDRAVTCTLDQVVSNVENFYNDFAEGGWIAYGASLKPSNNLFGAILEVSDLAARAGAEAEQAAREEASGAGYQPTRRCVKPVSPLAACMKKCRDRFPIQTSPEAFACFQGCSGLSTALTACEPGGYEVSTPGELVGNMIETSFAAPILRVVNAQDVVALVNAVANSIINKLITAGTRGLRGVEATVPNTNSYGITNPCAQLPSGPSRRQCERDFCANLEPEEKAACEAFASSTSTPPGFGTTTTSTVRITPPEEYNLIVDATTGWNGSLAHNPNNNTWLVVSQDSSLTAIFGRVISNSGAYVTPAQVTLNDRGDGWSGGSPRVAFAPSENRYLVVFTRTITDNLNRIYGQFVAADGSLIGSNFVINPEMSGVTFFRDGGGLRYDSRNRKFVLVWEHRSGGSIQVYLKTVSVDGVVSAPVQVSNNSAGDYQGAPEVAINQQAGEYCVAYQNYGITSTSNESQIGIRRVDAGNLSVGSQTFASVRAFGRTNINYNTRDQKYLVTWAAFDAVSILQGRFLGGCSAPIGEDSFTIAVDFWDGGVAYNPRSNSYGVVGATEDVRSRFIALSADGRKIFESDFFYDANNGNYLPTLAPNLTNGSYGLVSSKDYAVFRFAPDAGVSVLGSP